MERFALFLKPFAIKDLDHLRKNDAVMVADAIEKFLSYSPRKESRSRIKKLRGIGDPDYRLRLRDYRVIYNVDVVERRVNILRILHKEQTRKYYEEVTK